jgi:hypothetical protein
MYILLEPGMIIEISDECYFENEWCNVGLTIGDAYREDHVPMRRRIDTISELVEALKSTTHQDDKENG